MKLLAHFTQAISNNHILKKLTKTYIFTRRYKHFTTSREIDKEVVDGLFYVKKQTFLVFSPRQATGG